MAMILMRMLLRHLRKLGVKGKYMPIYKFQCEACEHQFESLVMKRDETVSCPSCASKQLRKLITAASIGSGVPDTPCGNAPCSPVPMCAGGGCGG